MIISVFLFILINDATVTNNPNLDLPGQPGQHVTAFLYFGPSYSQKLDEQCGRTRCIYRFTAPQRLTGLVVRPVTGGLHPYGRGHVDASPVLGQHVSQPVVFQTGFAEYRERNRFPLQKRLIHVLVRVIVAVRRRLNRPRPPDGRRQSGPVVGVRLQMPRPVDPLGLAVGGHHPRVPLVVIVGRRWVASLTVAVARSEMASQRQPRERVRRQVRVRFL